MKQRSVHTIVLVLSLLLARPTSAALIYDIDFEAPHVVGSQPSLGAGPDLLSGRFGDLTVSNTLIASGNSLRMLSTPPAAGTIASMTLQLPSPPTGIVRVSADVQLEQMNPGTFSVGLEGPPFNSMRWSLVPAPGGGTGLSYRWNQSGAQTDQNFPAQPVLGTTHHFDWEFDIGAGEARAWMDGTQLFSEPMTSTNFNSVRFISGTSEVFIDNVRVETIEVVPEPSRALLLALGMIGFWSRRTRDSGSKL